MTTVREMPAALQDQSPYCWWLTYTNATAAKQAAAASAKSMYRRMSSSRSRTASQAEVEWFEYNQPLSERLDLKITGHELRKLFVRLSVSISVPNRITARAKTTTKARAMTTSDAPDIGIVDQIKRR
jgi:HEPN domain-containing protein